MEQGILITECRNLLNSADNRLNDNNLEGYALCMSDLLKLLTKELAIGEPSEPEKLTPDGVA